jgi:predicted short-subunit dehydrogenase-like oxidoreductase (DUF2520 family)
MAISSVSFIGSGNLATHLAKAFIAARVKIESVYSPNYEHSSLLANITGAKSVKHIKRIIPADLIIICVTDSAIQEVSSLLQTKSMVVHTSGSTSIDVLNHHLNFGVFYPFQTFSKNVELDFSQIPVFLEANNHSNLTKLKELAARVSSKVIELNSGQRLKLHLSAVFASNFSNHMYSIARDILSEADISFDILKHLIHETTLKALKSDDPASGQTGPAVRNNINILEQHKEFLANKPLWQKIYTFVSDSIMERETERKNGTFQR